MSNEYDFIDKADEVMRLFKLTLPKISDPNSLLKLDEYLILNPIDTKTLITVMCDFANEIDKLKSLDMLRKKNHRFLLKKDAIIKLWKSGKYTSKDICAEQECANLVLSFSTARKYLRNI